MTKLIKKIKESKDKKVWDVVVLGGGPAGMMTAATAAARGKQVLLLEKNNSLGKKLLITGGGRCNVTNNKPVVREMLKNYQTAGKFLFSTFDQHGVTETIEWFTNRAVSLKEENSGRMFPVSDSAQSIWDALYKDLQKFNVEIRTRQTVTGIIHDDDEHRFTIQLSNKNSILAHSCVVATGGTSRPETGSTGEGFSWLASFGHTIRTNDYALVPIALKDEWVKSLGGVSLEKVKLTLLADDKKHSVYTGKLLFTHFGISGPMILNMSRTVGDVLQHSTATLALDIMPELDAGALRIKLQELLVTESNRKLKNVLAKLIPSALVTPLLTLAKIDGETPSHSVRSAARTSLVARMKSIVLTVDHLLGAEKAIITDGGVTLTEIDFKNIESRLVPGLYIVGDLLDINRPSGGYSLQICWSTGYVAGMHA